MISLFFQYHLRRISRYFKTKRAAKFITAGAFFLLFGAIAVGIYAFMREGFAFIISDEFLRAALPLYVYELFLLILSHLIFASALITGLFTLFRSESDGWIMASPKYSLMPRYAFARVFAASVWPLLILAVPALLAVHKVFAIGVGGMTLGLLAIILLALLLTLLALVIVFASAIAVRYALRRASMGAVALVLAALFISISVVAWQRSATTDILELFEAGDLRAEVAGISVIVERFRIFPSHPAALALYSIEEGGAPGSVTKPLAALAAAALAALLAYRLLSRAFLPLWQALQEGRFEARPAFAKATAGKPGPRPFPRWFKTPLGAVFEKEMLMLFRNTRELMWFGFLLAIWAAQTAMNLFLKANIERHRVDPANAPLIIQAFQIVVIVYFISAFALRFVFPAFSTERRTAWLLAASPLSPQKIFRGKYLFYAASFTILAITMGVLNAFLLGGAVTASALFVVFAAASTLTVVAFGLGLGALFPNFETDDPQALSTTLPGLGFIAGSLIYGAIGAYAFHQVVIGSGSAFLMLYFLLSAGIVAFMLSAAPKALVQTEFIEAR